MSAKKIVSLQCLVERTEDIAACCTAVDFLCWVQRTCEQEHNCVYTDLVDGVAEATFEVTSVADVNRTFELAVSINTRAKYVTEGGLDDRIGLAYGTDGVTEALRAGELACRAGHGGVRRIALTLDYYGALMRSNDNEARWFARSDGKTERNPDGFYHCDLTQNPDYDA